MKSICIHCDKPINDEHEQDDNPPFNALTKWAHSSGTFVCDMRLWRQWIQFSNDEGVIKNLANYLAAGGTVANSLLDKPLDKPVEIKPFIPGKRRLQRKGSNA